MDWLNRQFSEHKLNKINLVCTGLGWGLLSLHSKEFVHNIYNSLRVLKGLVAKNKWALFMDAYFLPIKSEIEAQKNRPYILNTEIINTEVPAKWP
jgi:hypothetical protein